jgi:hypothetical protein
VTKLEEIRKQIEDDPEQYAAIAKGVSDPNFFLAAYLVAAGVLGPDEAHALLLAGAFEAPGAEPGPANAPLGGTDWLENLRGIPRGPGFSEQAGRGGGAPITPAMDRAAAKITRVVTGR